MLKTKVIKIKWIPSTKEYYERLGYSFTKYNDSFQVSIEHLLDNSTIYIEYECDYCHKVLPKKYCNYIQTKNKDIIHADSCKECYMKIKRIEEFEYKQKMGLLKKGMPFYWYFRENRMNELKIYLEKHGHINNITKKNNEGYLIYYNFESYNDSIENAIEELGYNLDIVKERKTRGYYYDFEKVKIKIE